MVAGVTRRTNARFESGTRRECAPDDSAWADVVLTL